MRKGVKKMPKRKSNLKNFLEVKNKSDEVAELYFYGDIVSDSWQAWTNEDKYPEEVKDFMNEIGNKELNIYINSGGGSVYAGHTIFNILSRHQGKKTVFIDGIAASIASVIAFVGDEIVMPKNAYLMIHKPWVGMWGNADDLREEADHLDRLTQTITTTYKDNLISEDMGVEIEEFMKGDKYFDAEEAAKYFSKVRLVEANEAVAYMESEFIKDAPFQTTKIADLKNAKNEIEQKEQKEALDKELMELDLYLELENGGITK